MATAELTNYRQSPRKVRLVANLIRGKRVEQALTALAFLPKRAAGPMEKLLLSALSNAASTSNLKREDLFIKEIRVDQGVTLKRMMPRARGRGARINKRSSHIRIVLDDAANMKKK